MASKKKRRRFVAASNPLPVDSDIEIDGGREARGPSRFRWRDAGLVFLGGTLGTALREVLTLSIPVVAGIPVAILAINVVGAFFLGMLIETLVCRPADGSSQRAQRLFFGTGVLGGFTTYSALATESARLVAADQTITSIAYLFSTVVGGGFATWVGILWAANRTGRAAESRTPREDDQ